MKKTNNLRILTVEPAISPDDLRAEFPVTEKSSETLFKSRVSVKDIIEVRYDRFLIVTGPCSIHDENAAIEYAEKLNRLRLKYEDRLYIVMRVYFEKPRTTVGWRGMIIDPELDGSYNINMGLRKARKLLQKITDMGLPTATEVLDPIIPQYIADLISWAAVGARTTESQTHRNMVSGLSMPVGFKNGTDGSVEKAINAIESARSPHSFLGIDDDGKTCILSTSGNEATHLILRGGIVGPNYYEETVEDAEELFDANNINASIIVDCSHANSGKKHQKQFRVLRSVLEQRNRHDSIKGVMIESNLFEGNQKIPTDIKTLAYGVSITDECVGWDETERMMDFAWNQLA
ncbi:MAG: 3-deoxy-7-phosphoheptulonate synthase [Spirochaetales bacterium]|uniref:Phospho-2-dehydro-3-deoxyheptonate aldolase n=1 Tax=Candidatus Thalassospirochaeta sargassi TaxID=3119039 RepID=A0AAJ1MN76_9SPIO|nr:3-deoxy-7-phosphoheptulonate synthase [Spirochaetales bacterium]